jgi:hypothetical protein
MGKSRFDVLYNATEKVRKYATKKYDKIKLKNALNSAITLEEERLELTEHQMDEVITGSFKTLDGVIDLGPFREILKTKRQATLALSDYKELKKIIFEEEYTLPDPEADDAES